ncbi:hypothetical protein [Thalassotalea marina]|uniref:Uncharacterized protein n=1 Tax=Thalassotalea marina TaxID=1673741 RepID=A0A919BJZ9_9GAMM|nr:hypothetical protein [Thalassotalea marina]GHF95222.1 hypothetical protein GCM10017161_24420 [Thalassotalea marina]
MNQFKHLSVLTSAIAALLAILLLFLPEVVFWLFAIVEHDSATFIGRRAAMLFLGIAFICWLARNAKHSQARQAICLGLAVSMLSLATLGLYELIRGAAGLGIILAITTEVVLALWYVQIWFKHKNLASE